MIIQWIILSILILLGFVFLKLEHHGRKIKIAIVIFIFLFLYFSMMALFSSDQVSLKSPRGIVNSIYIYLGWIGQTSTAIWDIGKDTVDLVGNTIKLNRTDIRGS